MIRGFFGVNQEGFIYLIESCNEVCATIAGGKQDCSAFQT